MANAKGIRKARQKTPENRCEKSLARKIEGIDKKMQVALEKGDFVAAKELAEEQERLLECLMLSKHGS